MAQEKRKKKFFEVDMPQLEKEAHLMAYETAELKGRIIVYDLTRIMKGKSILAKLKVEIEENGPIAKLQSINIMPNYLRRMVRKGTDYVEDSLIIQAKDKKIQIKPLLITRRHVSRKVKNALREEAKKWLIENISEKESGKLFEEVLKNVLQKDLSLVMKKIYPLSSCEIRSLEIFTKNKITKQSSE